LVVEDEESMRILLDYILSKAGYQVTTAKDGTEAWQHVQDTLPEVIVADVTMPGMDGLELCRRLRNDPQTEAIPFIFLSSRGQLYERIAGLGLGADDYVAKPFERRELLARLEAVLQRTDVYQDLSLTDKVTRLGNRRYFEQRLEEEIYRGRRYGVAVSLVLVMIDIGQIETIRQQHGSAAADFALRSVAQMLRSSVRALDITARFDDHEFCVLMPHTNKASAVSAVKRLYEAVGRKALVYNGQKLDLTANFGVSFLSDNGMDRAHLLAGAQRAIDLARSQRGGVIYIWDGEHLEVVRPGEG